MVKHCCMCKLEYGKIENVSFHMLPKEEYLKELWFKSIGREIRKTNKVCSRHFKKTDFYYKIIGGLPRRFLSHTAVPCPLENEVKSGNIEKENVDVNTSIDKSTVSSQPDEPSTSNDASAIDDKTENKRESDDASDASTSIKRLKKGDFTSESSWKVLQTFRQETKLKQKLLNQKIKRLNQRIDNVRSLVGQLKEKGLLSNEVYTILKKSSKIS